MVKGLRYKVGNFGCRILGFGFRVLGFGFQIRFGF
jgi:hypothetical protein